jgi:hypothetical protein
MIRHGNGRHSAPRGFVYEFANIASSVKEREIRMQMEMNKVRVSHAGIYSKPLRNSSPSTALVSARENDPSKVVNAALSIFSQRISPAEVCVLAVSSQLQPQKQMPPPSPLRALRVWLHLPVPAPSPPALW